MVRVEFSVIGQRRGCPFLLGREGTGRAATEGSCPRSCPRMSEGKSGVSGGMGEKKILSPLRILKLYGNYMIIRVELVEGLEGVEKVNCLQCKELD